MIFILSSHMNAKNQDLQLWNLENKGGDSESVLKTLIHI